MKRTVGANGHVRPTEVIVNGAHHAHNVQVLTADLFLC